MATNKTDWSSLYKKEDWWAVWLGAVILIIATAKIVTTMPTFKTWTNNPCTAVPVETIPQSIYLGIGLLILTSIAIIAMKENLKGYIAGFPVVFILGFLAFWLCNQKGIKGWGLESVLWALLFGLFISNIIGVPKWLKASSKTELFIKIGLVLLGAEILFHVVLKAGVYGLTQAVIVILLVFYFCYWLGQKMGMSQSFSSIMASGVSICGVSATIAAGGAIKGDQKEISYTISLVLLCAMPMLVGMPIIAKAMGLPDGVAGAWLGGTIDTTPAVVAAGALYSKKAMEAAAIVKMSQNVLIGLVAFLLALYWTLIVEKKPDVTEKPRAIEIWYRFPKFIVGFVVASIVFSLILVPSMGEKSVQSILRVSGAFRSWLFVLAFICIGLDTRFGDLVKFGGGKPAIVFFVSQAFNILVTFVLAYLLFGGVLFPAPF